ncbi:glycerophosphodiester phosphodiesterase family protein [Xanthocytophaga flava]|uniref:glycerophosphodiester phosphodiesterase family protein n=1 Tax=Xanthocytophaga flava TaxID=3048013 RepID=UPI0028D220F8|nr:glycerophosphodiester phosphodiesterase family protein [Xanthocytophaga flavus]MDJ1470286.1 glycerophosphodiester phosphodiesterase family protein [Xanthocytophaga flavus]
MNSKVFGQSTLERILSVKEDTLVLAFGSCNKHDLPQPLWKDISNDKPHSWIWLGDNIYGDSEDMQVLKTKYESQLQQKEYKKLASVTRIIGTWDDHDFGVNDGNRTYAKKEESQQLFLDFLGESKSSPLRLQKGVYSSHRYKVGRTTVKVILLDVRYHQDPVNRIDGVCQPNFKGDILGEAQWKWLEQELAGSDASIHIIGSGLQIIPADHKDEKWENFPKSRKRFFELLAKYKIPGVIVLSGDRHMAEVSTLTVEGLDYPMYEITSSGLTHAWETLKPDVNRYRISPIIPFLNYGLLKISSTNDSIQVRMEIKGQQGFTYWLDEHTYKNQITPSYNLGTNRLGANKVGANKVQVVAHRGDWFWAPENSLAGFQNCIEMGVDIIELDVRLSKDSIPVVIHDLTLDRTTNGAGNVADYTLKALKTLYLKDATGVLTKERVPTLEEVLLLAKNRIILYLDKSADKVERILPLLQKTGTLKQTMFVSDLPYEKARKQFGNSLDSILFVPVIADQMSNLSSYVDEYLAKMQPVAFQFRMKSPGGAAYSQLRKITQSSSKAFVAATWADHSLRHDDQISRTHPDQGWRWLIEQGFTILETNRPQQLLEYLRTQKLHK